MSAKRFWSCLAPALAILILSSLIGCAGAGGKKIPVTTSSKKAREHFMKGRDLSEKLRNVEAREFFEMAVAEDPDFAMAYLYLAFSQPTAQGFFDNLDKAAALMDKISEGESYWIMGTIAAANADPMKQRKYYKKLVEVYPEDERALNLLGNHYFGQQEYNKAIELYEKAIAINPDFSQSYNQLGYSYRFLNNYEEAEKAFQKYIELIPDDPNPYDSYAELLLKMGKYDQSIEYYRKALSVNPSFAASYLGIATNLNLKGEHAAAREEVQKLYDNAANDGQKRAALFGMCISYVDEGNMDEAIRQAEKIYEIDEASGDDFNMAGDLNVIGNILFEQGKYKKAQEKYAKSLEAIEKSDLADEVKENFRRLSLYNQGRVALKLGDPEMAREKSAEYTEKVVAINNAFQIWLAHELAGMIAMAEKDYKLAIAEFSKANQQNPYTFYRMGLVYQGMGDNKNAGQMFAKAAAFNAVNNINYAFIRAKAEKMLLSL